MLVIYLLYTADLLRLIKIRNSHQHLHVHDAIYGFCHRSGMDKLQIPINDHGWHDRLPFVLLLISISTLILAWRCMHKTLKLLLHCSALFYSLYSSIIDQNDSPVNHRFHGLDESRVWKCNFCRSAQRIVRSASYLAQSYDDVTPFAKDTGDNIVLSGSACFCCQHSIAQPHLCGKLSHVTTTNTAALVIPWSKYNNDLWLCVSWCGIMSLEQLANFQIIVSITASIRPDIEDGAFYLHRLCWWTLNKHFLICCIKSKFNII